MVYLKKKKDMNQYWVDPNLAKFQLCKRNSFLQSHREKKLKSKYIQIFYFMDILLRFF